MRVLKAGMRLCKCAVLFEPLLGSLYYFTISFMNSCAGSYHGQIQKGGTGGPDTPIKNHKWL